ncbi:nucleotide exchange factor GrpE [Candidatus Gracilibacteria bacterium]|nr:nucleotide exchange factor GrpE [Candidatus Gracilibacteria bacterium]
MGDSRFFVLDSGVTRGILMSDNHTPTHEDPVADTATENGSVSDMAELQQRALLAEAQAAEHKDQLLRTMADFKNYKRRTDAERAELIRSAGADTLLALLPIVDDFDLAVESVPTEIAATPWWGGTQLIAHKLRTTLEAKGVREIEALGTDFDPNLHEAITYEDAPGQDGKVIAVVRRGYRLNDRVLRPAMVKVGRG